MSGWTADTIGMARFACADFFQKSRNTQFYPTASAEAPQERRGMQWENREKLGYGKEPILPIRLLARNGEIAADGKIIARNDERPHASELSH